MLEWFEQLPGLLEAAPIASEHLHAWPDAAFAQGLPHLHFVPIVDSELQLAAHHLLLALRRAPHGWEVVADLREPTLRRPTFSPTGEWQPGYKPLALRLLPFAVSSTNRIYFLSGGNDQSQPRTRQQMEAVQKSLMTLYAGRKRLSERVNRLLDQGWIRAPDYGELLRPAPPQSSELSVSSENWDAAELLLILEFSQKQRLGASWLRGKAGRLRESQHFKPDLAPKLQNFLNWEDNIFFELLTPQKSTGSVALGLKHT